MEIMLQASALHLYTLGLLLWKLIFLYSAENKK